MYEKNMNHLGLGGGVTQTLVVRPLRKTLLLCVSSLSVPVPINGYGNGKNDLSILLLTFKSYCLILCTVVPCIYKNKQHSKCTVPLREGEQQSCCTFPAPNV